MRNDHELAILATAPAAAVSLANFDEVKRPLILVVPAGVLNFLAVGINQDQASGPEQWFHSSVV